MRYCILVIYCLMVPVSIIAQDTSTGGAALTEKQAAAFLSALISRLELQESRARSTGKSILARWENANKKLYRKLRKKDPAAAATFLADAEKSCSAARQGLQALPPDPGIRKRRLRSPALDSLESTLAFLMSGTHKDNPLFRQLELASGKLRILRAEMQNLQSLQYYLESRNEQLLDQFSNLGFSRNIHKLFTEAASCRQAVDDLRSIVQDRKKIEKKVLLALQRNKKFQDFMGSHLPFLTGLPAMGSGQTPPDGLQTIARVQALLAARLGGSSVPIPGQAASGPLLPQQINGVPALPGAPVLPVSRPGQPGLNSQRNKPFAKRLEFGMNLQTQRSGDYFPTRSSLSISAGYKMNDKAVIGLGGSLLLGWGESWKSIRVTSQGAGFHCYADLRFKGELWISLVAEQQFNRLNSLPGNTTATRSHRTGLIGLTKKFKTGGKAGNVQLLYDLSYPRSNRYNQPILFRMGYNL